MRLLIGLFLILAMAAYVAPAFCDQGGRKIVFEEQKIEGKIRRPQLVLIKADQRPEFKPMVLQSLEGNTNIAEFVDQSIIDSSPYDGVFKFDGTRISNYVP
jgi:hypothetical protein